MEMNITCQKTNELNIQCLLILKQIVGLKMEVAITKISQNGQVVIPAEIRHDAQIKPSTKFLVFNEGEHIVLKRIRKNTLAKDIKLLERIHKSEEQIIKGKSTKASTNMSDEDIDHLLMS